MGARSSSASWSDPKKWNVAGDYALNQILVDSGFTLDDNWLIDNKFKGMSADEIYNLLPDGDGEGGEGGGLGPSKLTAHVSGPDGASRTLAQCSMHT
jgi:hypothetical protein